MNKENYAIKLVDEIILNYKVYAYIVKHNYITRIRWYAFKHDIPVMFYEYVY